MVFYQASGRCRLWDKKRVRYLKNKESRNRRKQKEEGKKKREREGRRIAGCDPSSIICNFGGSQRHQLIQTLGDLGLSIVRKLQ